METVGGGPWFVLYTSDIKRLKNLLKKVHV